MLRYICLVLVHICYFMMLYHTWCSWSFSKKVGYVIDTADCSFKCVSCHYNPITMSLYIGVTAYNRNCHCRIWVGTCLLLIAPVSVSIPSAKAANRANPSHNKSHSLNDPHYWCPHAEMSWRFTGLLLSFNNQFLMMMRTYEILPPIASSKPIYPDAQWRIQVCSKRFERWNIGFTKG